MYAKDTPVTCLIALAKDRSFTFAVGAPKTSHLLKLAARGSMRVLDKDCVNIARIKLGGDGDEAAQLKAMAKAVVGTARSMRFEVVRTAADANADADGDANADATDADSVDRTVGATA